MWAVETTLLLSELAGGFAENKRALTKLSDQTKDGLVQILSAAISSRIESKHSAVAFEGDVHAMVRESHELSDSGRLFLRYVRFRLNYREIDDLRAIPYAVWFEARFSLVDQYLAYMRALVLIACDSRLRQYRDLLWSQLRALDGQFHDSRIGFIATYLDPSAMPEPTDGQSTIGRIITDYTLGEYEKVIDVASSELVLAPQCFSLYELLAKSIVRTNRPPPIISEPTSLRQQVLHHMCVVLARGPGTADSIQRLVKLAQVLDSLPIGAQLLGFYLQQRHPDHTLSAVRLSAFNENVFSPRFSEVYGNPRQSVEFLNALQTTGVSSIATALFEQMNRSYQSGEPISFPDGVPKSRQLKYQARALLAIRHYTEAVSLYQQLRVLSSADPIDAQDAVMGLYRCYLATDDLSNAVALVTGCYLGHKELLTPIHLKALIERYEADDTHTAKGSIGWSLLYFAYYVENGIIKDSYKLFTACDDFLAAQHVDRPSRLSAAPQGIDPQVYVFFLRHICVPDVLDYSYHLDGSEALEVERIKICQRLSEIDPQNADGYAAEITRLTRQSMVRQALQRVDESKVYVDTDRIKEILSKSLPAQFERYLAFASLSPGDRARRMVIMNLDPSALERIRFSDGAYELFCELFSQIRQQFVLHKEFGLDSYLSLRIRHGTLEGQIRSQFEGVRLITRLGKTSVYQSNTYWIEQIASDHAEDRQALDALLSSFSTTIDSIISRVRTRWVQIRGKSNDNAGLFDYDYSLRSLEDLYIAMGGIRSYDEFVNVAFDLLWHRTNQNLTVVRGRILSELLSELTQELDRLEQDIYKIEYPVGLSISGAIAQCRTNLQKGLKTVAGWFNLAEKKQFPEFDFQHLLNTSIQYIRRLFPATVFEPRVDIQGIITCKGWTFHYFVDLSFILLENVVRYADPENANIGITVTRESGYLRILVQNTVPESTSDEELLLEVGRIEARVVAKEAATQEGKTGFVKLHKLIEHDLKVTDYDVRFPVSGRRFVVDLKIRDEGILS